MHGTVGSLRKRLFCKNYDRNSMHFYIQIQLLFKVLYNYHVEKTFIYVREKNQYTFFYHFNSDAKLRRRG